MRKQSKPLLLLLAAAMLFSLLAGCKSTAESPQSELKDDTLIMTVDTKPVYWDEFRYWLYSSLQYTGNDPNSEIDWEQMYQDRPLSDFVLSEAVEAVRLYKTVENKCGEHNISLSEENASIIASMHDSSIEQLGSEEEYLGFLEDNMLNKKLVEYIYTISYLHNDLFIETFGENGSKITDEEALAFGDENGYYRAKHILLKSVDDNGNSLSEEQLEENREKLQSILDEINSSDDPSAKFDELMNENSEDPGSQSYPDGYQFDLNINFNQNFLNEATSLEVNEISEDIIEMEGMGYTILMRLPLLPDIEMLTGYGDSLRSTAAATQFQTLLETWADEATVKYEKVFHTIKPEEIFGAAPKQEE